MIIEKDGELLSLDQFQKLTGAQFVPKLTIDEPKILADLQSRAAKLLKNKEMTREQIWFGSYFQKEILSGATPDVVIRWISPQLGWGVFAARPFRKMEFITEYEGIIRKGRRGDDKNAYCFEYVLAEGIKTPYTIDAMEQGGISRYINHSSSPNLLSSLATFNNLSHVILYAKEPIPKGAQLCYDYGPAYWSRRSLPLNL